MTKNLESRCWYCGGSDLEADSRGFRCRSCGTTYNVLHSPGSSPVTIDNDPQSGNFQYKKESHSRPSSSVARRAAKVRGDNP